MASATIPFQLKSECLPSEVCHWSTDRLSDEAVRAIQTCRKHGLAAAQSAWRAGAYLSLLHARLIGCDRAGARDYAAFLGFFFLEPS